LCILFLPQIDATFAGRVEKKVRDKETAIILLDQAGTEARGAGAELLAAGYEKVYVVAGGAQAWKNAELPWKVQ
jgi:rhodanese-related sulfurtransferase